MDLVLARRLETLEEALHALERVQRAITAQLGGLARDQAALREAIGDLNKLAAMKEKGQRSHA